MILIEGDSVVVRHQSVYVSLPLPPQKNDEGFHNYVVLDNTRKLLHHYYSSGNGVFLQSREIVPRLSGLRARPVSATFSAPS